MKNRRDNLIDLIYEKLKKNKSRSLNLKKEEFNKFINILINKS